MAWSFHKVTAVNVAFALVLMYLVYIQIGDPIALLPAATIGYLAGINHAGYVVWKEKRGES